MTLPPARVTPRDGLAWVTGASSGIGRAVALTLAREGWQVAVSARSREGLESLRSETKRSDAFLIVPADVSDRASVQAAAATLERAGKPVALAVLNAGIYLPLDVTAFDSGAFRRTLDTNVMGTVHALEAVLPGMIRLKRGHIAIVSSVTGYGGLPTSAAYGASKAALINLAETLFIELYRHGVRVTVVNPGFIDTPATADNPFPMPFLMPVDKAARRLVRGLKSDAFEITFPRRFTYGLKLLGLLPAHLRLALVRRATGFDKAPPPVVQA